MELEFRILIVSWIPDSKAQDSGIQKEKVLHFRNSDSLSWSEIIEKKSQYFCQISINLSREMGPVDSLTL